MTDLNKILPLEKISLIKISPQSLPIEPDMRIIWKLTQVLLVLHYSSRGNTASLKKIHFFLSYLENPQKANFLKNINVGDKLERLRLRIPFNPYITKVIKYGIITGLIEIKSQSLKLTDLAKNFLQMIENDNNLMIIEKEILKSIGKTKFLEKTIENIMKGE